MTALVLLDPTATHATGDPFAPITTARPLAEVRVGARLMRERWSHALARPVVGTIAAPHLGSFEEPSSAPVLLNAHVVAAGTVIADASFAPSLVAIDHDDTDTWTCDGRVVATLLRHDTPVEALRTVGLTAGAVPTSLDGWRLGKTWDLIGTLPAMLKADVSVLASSALPPQTLPDDVRVLGSYPVRIADSATIEPFVVLDATQGAIIIEDHATVRSFSRLTGPFVLGRHSQWMTGSGHTVSIGDYCKVSGEVSTAIFCGHANKGHDGFVGHSYLGRWCNLGAGTVTSNLKNTYRHVAFAGEDTALQFLGSIIGDHAKTGILTRLTTGSCIGAGANVISDDVVPNVVPPFAWGARGQTYELDRFLQTAERVMARRSVVLTDAMRACLVAVYHRSTSERT